MAIGMCLIINSSIMGSLCYWKKIVLLEHGDGSGSVKQDHYQGLSRSFRENKMEYLEVTYKWITSVHVVLDNKLYAVESDTPKETLVTITLYKPLGYLLVPGLLTVTMSSNLILKQRALKNQLF